MQLFKLRDNGYSLTDLDRYFIRYYKPLINGCLEDVVEGRAFLHPTGNDRIFDATVYPYRFHDDTQIPVFIPDSPPVTTLPTYVAIQGKKKVYSTTKVFQAKRIRNPEKYVNKYIDVSSHDIIPLEDLKSDIFSPSKNRLKDYFSMFRSLILYRVQGYGSPDLFDELSESVLADTEIEGKEDLLPLLAVSCPVISPVSEAGKKPGGFHAHLSGTRIASVRNRILELTRDPILSALEYWTAFAVGLRGYRRRFQQRDLITNEYAVILETRRVDKNEKLYNLPFDYPIQVVSAPTAAKDKENSRLFENPDILNYLTYLTSTSSLTFLPFWGKEGEGGGFIRSEKDFLG